MCVISVKIMSRFFKDCIHTCTYKHEKFIQFLPLYVTMGWATDGVGYRWGGLQMGWATDGAYIFCYTVSQCHGPVVQYFM